jgi:5-methylthioadenosine/S-adenosylhomocysteine deaminase
LSNYQLQKQVFNNLAQAKAEIQKIGSDPGGVARMFTKAVHFCIKVENLRPKVCNIIKQDMLSLGGDAAVHKHVIDAKVETSDILIMGTVKQFHQLGLLEGEELIKNWHGKSNGRITTMLGPHAPYTCSPAYLEKVMALAEKYQVGIHIHVAETSGEFNDIKQQYGKTPVGHLNSLGLFDYPTLAAHCVHLTDEDINILHEKGVAVAHNPESNMKLASGVAPVVKLLNKGVTVALGTDGASSNNNLDMLEEMRSAALLHKATGDPTVIYSYQALEMATKNGAKALGLEDKIGMLKPGMMADLILFDFDKPHLYPKHDILAHLVYSAQSSDVDTVIVNGKIVVQGGKPLTIDSKETCQQVQKVAERITGSDMLNGR